MTIRYLFAASNLLMHIDEQIVHQNGHLDHVTITPIKHSFSHVHEFVDMNTQETVRLITPNEKLIAKINDKTQRHRFVVFKPEGSEFLLVTPVRRPVHASHGPVVRLDIKPLGYDAHTANEQLKHLWPDQEWALEKPQLPI